MKVMAIGAHFDDVEIGCGGALLRHRDAGDELHILTLTSSEYNESAVGASRAASEALSEGQQTAANLRAGLSHLDFLPLRLHANDRLISTLFVEIGNVRPGRLYCHFTGESHSDHAAAAVASLLASQAVPQVLMFRSNFQSGLLPWHPTYFIDISEHMLEKLAMLRMFKSERRKHAAWRRIALSNARQYGQMTQRSYSEAFMVHRFLEFNHE